MDETERIATSPSSKGRETVCYYVYIMVHSVFHNLFFWKLAVFTTPNIISDYRHTLATYKRFETCYDFEVWYDMSQVLPQCYWFSEVGAGFQAGDPGYMPVLASGTCTMWYQFYLRPIHFGTLQVCTSHLRPLSL